MITSLTRRADFIGSGTTGPFSFAFRIFDVTDLQVSLQDILGNVSVLSWPSAFTVQGVMIGNDTYGAGGLITLVTPLAVGEKLTILRSPAQTQPRSFANGGPFFPKNHEEAFDRLTMLVQAQEDEIARSIKQSVTDGVGSNLILPPASASKLLGWDVTGTQLANWDNNFKESAVENFVNGIGFTSGVTTVLTLQASPGTAANATVFFDGVEQDHTKWTLNNKNVNFNAAIVATKVEIIYRRVIDVSAQVGANTRNARQFGAIGDGITDDTVAIQNLWNWSSQTGGWAVIDAGTYIIDQLVIRDGMRVYLASGAGGESAGAILKHKAGSTKDMIVLSAGVMQRVTLSGGKFRGNGNAGKHGVYLHAQPIMVDGVVQGGIWFSLFDNLDVRDFLGEQIWLRGTGDGNGPNQFLVFHNPQVVNASVTRRALRLTGQIGQVEIIGGLFDGIGRALGVENILIQRSVDDSDANDSDRAPYSINFRGTTSQSCNRIATVERAFNIMFDGAHFEEAQEGIVGGISVVSLKVINSEFGNVGHRDNGDGSGWCVKNTSGHVIAENNTFLSSSDSVAPDTHYINLTGANDFGLSILGQHYDTTGIRTSGVSVQLGPATAFLDIGGFTTVGFQTSGVAITGIRSKHVVGTVINILASDGPLFFDVDISAAPPGTVPLVLSAYGRPFRLVKDAVATFVLTDFGSTLWRLITAGMPMGNMYPVPVSINFSGNVNATGGTELVDASDGNIVRTLQIPPAGSIGLRITIKKVEPSVHTVQVTPTDGGSYTLTSGDQWVECEWTGANWQVVGIGASLSNPQSPVVTTATTQVTPWGFTTQGQATDLAVAVNACIAALKRIGLFS